MNKLSTFIVNRIVDLIAIASGILTWRILSVNLVKAEDALNLPEVLSQVPQAAVSITVMAYVMRWLMVRDDKNEEIRQNLIKENIKALQVNASMLERIEEFLSKEK